MSPNQKKQQATIPTEQEPAETLASSLAAINSITDALSGSLDFETVIEQVIEAVTDYMQAPSAAIFRLDEASQSLVMISGKGFSSKTIKEGSELPLEGSLSGIAVAQNSIAISEELGQDERLVENVRVAMHQQGLKSAVSIPLSFQGGVLGVMNLLFDHSRSLDQLERDTLLTISKNVGLAMANHRYINQIKSQMESSQKTEKALKEGEERLQESLERRSRQVELSTQVAQEIAAAPNLDELYHAVVTQVKEQFGYYHAQLLRYDPALEIVALVVGYGEIGERMLELNHSVPVGVGIIGTAAATGQSILRSHVTEDPDWRPNTLLPDTQSELAVPIRLGDKILGVLDVQSNVPGQLNEDDQIMLEGLCGQIAIAIESTTLRQEMEARLSDLHILQGQMSREGWSDFQKSKKLVPGYQFDHVGLKPIDSPTMPEQSSVNGEGKNGQSSGPNLTSTESVRVPLQVRGESIGVVGVQDDPNRPLSDEDQQFLQAISEELSEALEAARLFEQTQDALAEQERLTSELETVAQVSTAASTILEVDALLQSVVDLSRSSFDLYHTHIYLVNETSNKLVLKAGAGNVGRLMTLEGREISLDAESVVARAARTRQGVIENNVRKTLDFLPHPLLPNTQSEMAVPMVVGDKLVGVLDLQSDEEDRFTEEELQIQKTLAAQIAVAVENAQQYAEQVQTATKLRELDQLKSEFLASMSHELRTPLNSIIGFADVLLEGLDGNLNERMEEDVRLIRESGSHLRELIGDILDMSKIEAGRMELRYEEVDLRQMANDLISTANPLAQEKSLSLYLDLDEKVDVIQADRTRLRQVFWNIMGNAIKFTDKGSVTLSIQAKDEHVLCSIRDTGIGIKEENIHVVFEQFRQIDGGLNRAAGGTGLGMPITKKLVELHGGTIWIESVVGQGTTFLFTLPYEAQPAPAALAEIDDGESEESEAV